MKSLMAIDFFGVLCYYENISLRKQIDGTFNLSVTQKLSLYGLLLEGSFP